MSRQIKIQFAGLNGANDLAEFSISEESYKLLTTYREFVSDIAAQDSSDSAAQDGIFIVPDIFTRENMIKLVSILENYKEPFDLEEYNKSRSTMTRDQDYERFGLKKEKFISLNYLDMIFFEFMGINIFNVSIILDNKEIVINLVDPIYKQEKALNELKEIGKFKNDELIIYEFCKTSGKTKEIRKPEIRGFCLMKNSETVKPPRRNFWEPEPIIPEGTWVRSKNHIYTSRINVIWESVDWNIIASYMNNSAIKPFLLNYVQTFNFGDFKDVREDQKESLYTILDKIGYNGTVVKKGKNIRPHGDELDTYNIEEYFQQELLE